MEVQELLLHSCAVEFLADLVYGQTVSSEGRARRNGSIANDTRLRSWKVELDQRKDSMGVQCNGKRSDEVKPFPQAFQMGSHADTLSHVLSNQVECMTKEEPWPKKRVSPWNKRPSLELAVFMASRVWGNTYVTSAASALRGVESLPYFADEH